MTTEYNRFHDPGQVFEGDSAALQHDLEEAHKTIRGLLRQIDKTQARYGEIARAYNKTVANLMEITRENALLEHERNMWHARAEGIAPPLNLGSGLPELTPAEVGAIRKAMARLHHPDTGGDAERMKAWNAALDPLDSKTSFPYTDILSFCISFFARRAKNDIQKDKISVYGKEV